MIIYLQSQLSVLGVIPCISRIKHVDLLETLEDTFYFLFIAHFHPFGETVCYSSVFSNGGLKLKLLVNLFIHQ